MSYLVFVMHLWRDLANENPVFYIFHVNAELNETDSYGTRQTFTNNVYIHLATA